MADNPTIHNGATGDGTAFNAATDDVGGVHYQRMKLVTAEDGSAEPIGDRDLGSTRALFVDQRSALIRSQVTPTISTSAYTAKDAVGGLMEWTNAARASGGAIRVTGIQIADKGQQRADLDLVLFDRSVTAPTDNAVFDPSDTEIGYVVGVIPSSAGAYSDLNDNSVLSLAGLSIDAVLNGTSLFGVLVARSTPTYTSTSDLVVALTIEQC